MFCCCKGTSTVVICIVEIIKKHQICIKNVQVQVILELLQFPTHASHCIIQEKPAESRGFICVMHVFTQIMLFNWLRYSLHHLILHSNTGFNSYINKAPLSYLVRVRNSIKGGGALCHSVWRRRSQTVQTDMSMLFCLFLLCFNSHK